VWGKIGEKLSFGPFTAITTVGKNGEKFIPQNSPQTLENTGFFTNKKR